MRHWRALALPAAFAAGLLLGAVGAAVAPEPTTPPAVARSQPAAADLSAGREEPEAVSPALLAGPSPTGALVRDTATLPPPGDTLPGPPVSGWEEGAPQGERPEPRTAAPAPVSSPPSLRSPAQDLPRGAAFGMPLIASVQGERLTFYSGWDAPGASTGLAGEWAAPGRCAARVRLTYEQAMPGLGAVRGSGELERAPGWNAALVLPRQHCARAEVAWTAARSPRGDEAMVLAPFLGAERPHAVVSGRDRLRAASATTALLARRERGAWTEVWRAEAPPGATVRLLGVWRSEGIWAAVRPDGRIVRVWRGG